jgi:hypothetical protein
MSGINENHSAIGRPSCRLALGFLGLGLSAFAWPHFPANDSRVAFASVFSLGTATTGAWLGSLVDAMTRRRRRIR